MYIMRNFKVIHRLLLLSGTFTLFIVLIALIVFNVLSDIERLNSINNANHNTFESILKLRKHEKDFLARDVINTDYFMNKESKYLNRYDMEHQHCKDHISFMMSNKELESVFDELSLLSTHLENYKVTFHKVAEEIFAKGFKDHGLIGNLRASIHEVESYISENNLKAEHAVMMLQLRRNEKDFMLRNDIAYQGKFNSNIEKFTQQINSDYGLRSNTQDKLTKLLENYQRDFNQVVTITQAIGMDEKSGLMGEMRAAIHQVEPIQEELLNKIESLVNSQITKAKSILLITMIVALLIVVTVSILISKSVISAIGGEPSEVRYIAENLAQGDLKVSIPNFSLRGGAIGSLFKMINKLQHVLIGIREATDELTKASSELNATSQQIAQGSSEQASSVEEISSSVEQITSGVQQNAMNSKQTESIARETASSIDNLGRTAEESTSSVKQIAEKISIINDISFQTNLLALNAAVEAARAGEHGKGFAVVAAEVRKLAERSKVAAQEIDVLSGESVSKSEQSAKLVSYIIPEVKKSADLMQEISASAMEQDTGFQQISSALLQLNDVTQSNSSSSEELAGSSSQLDHMAKQLADQISFFKLETNQRNYASSENSAIATTSQETSENDFEDF